MSFTYPDLRTWLHSVAPFIIPVISTWTSAGVAASSYGVDIYVGTATGEINLTPETGTGMYIYQPVAADALNRVRHLGAPTGVTTAIDTDNGRLYHDGAPWTANPTSGQRYELWSIDPKLHFDILNNITMPRIPLPSYGPLQRFANADCQSATGWTANAGSVALETGAGNVQTGAASLKFTASGAGDYLYGPSFSVTHLTSVFLSINYKVAAGDAAFYHVLYDETNGAEIESSHRTGHSREQFCVVQRTFTIPSGCERAHFRLVATNTTDIAYLDYVNGPWAPADYVVDLPTALRRVGNVRKVQTARYMQPISSLTGGYDAFSRVFDPPMRPRRDYNVRIDHASANPYKLETTQNYRWPAKERWVEYIRPASDLTTWLYTAAGETSPTCSAPIEIVGSYHVLDLCELAVRPDPEDWETARALDRLLGEKLDNGVRKGGELTKLLADYERDLETAPTYYETTGFGHLRF